MGHSLGIKGQKGRLRVGYQTAAQLGAFTLTPVSPSEWSVEAVATSTDSVWISQVDGRVLELEIGQQRWTWRTVSLAVVDGAVMGTVTGRPERR